MLMMIKLLLRLLLMIHLVPATFDEGNIAYFLREGKIPENKSVIDPTNLASGVLQYDFQFETR